MTDGIPRPAKSLSESLIDDSDPGTRSDFGFRKFPAVQNPSAHRLKISRQNRDHRRISLRGTPIQSECPPDKRRGIEWKEFSRTRGPNSRQAAYPIQHFLEIRELPLIHLVRRAVQRDARSDDSLHVITTVDAHQVHERASEPHRCGQQNHGEHDLRGYQSLSKHSRAAGPACTARTESL